MLQFVLGLVKFHHEINILKSILNKKSYPHDFVDKCIKMFLDRVLISKIVVSTVPKEDLMILLPYWVSCRFKFSLGLMVW